MKVLLVEDDESLAETLRQALVTQHYLVDIAADGQTGLELAETFEYDLILLDWTLPKLDGIHICKQLRTRRVASDRPKLGQSNRSSQYTPILLLTAHNSSMSKVIGFDAGVDDYVVKPFDLPELLVRVRALIRRSKAIHSPILTWGNLQLNVSNCEVSYDRRPLPLTSKEYSLLELFLRNQQRIFSQSVLLEHLWSSDESPSENAVRAKIKSLRQKLKEAGAGEVIETICGLGYRLKAVAAEVEQLTQRLALLWQSVGVEPETDHSTNVAHLPSAASEG